jgi:hypothetical protein
METNNQGSADDVTDVKIQVAARRYSHTPSVHEGDLGAQWNTNHETLVKSWSHRAECYSRMHDTAGKYYLRLHRWFGVPCKLILFAVGSIQFSQLSNSQDNLWSFYISGFIAMVGLMIELGKECLTFDQTASQHFTAAATYDKLHLDIQTQLSFDAAERLNVKAFLRHCKHVLSNMKETVNIPSHVLEVFLAQLLPIQMTGNVTLPVLQPQMRQIPPSDVGANIMLGNVPTTPVQTTTPEQNPPTTPVQCIQTTTPDSPPSSPGFSDIQDEFYQEMNRRYKQKQQQMEDEQLRRLQQHSQV